MRKDLLDKIVFYFENAPSHVPANIDVAFLNKVKSFILKLKPTRFWEKKGIFNKKLKINVYIDFIMLLEDKLIACEVEKYNLATKFNLFNGIKLFDEIWFFTAIPAEKNWLFYKLENNLKIKQRFFGLDEKGEIREINLKSAQSW